MSKTDDFWQTKNDKPVTIDKYCVANVKHFINDAVTDCKPSYVKSDVLSFIQFVCAATAIVAFLLDKLWTYPAYHNTLFYCCSIYFTFYGLSLAYSQFVVGKTILECHEPEKSGLDKGHQWVVKTDFDPLKALFIVDLNCTNLSNNKSNNGTLKKHVGSWISESGEVLCRTICKDVRALHDQVIGKIID